MTDRNFDGKPDAWDFYRDGSPFRSELDDNFDGEVDGWLRYSAGNFSEAKYDTDHNGVPDETVEYTRGILRLARLHPNRGPVEQEWHYVDGALRGGVCSDP